MMLSEYIHGLTAASDADELEAAIQVPFKLEYRGPTWKRICSVRIAAGQRIVAAHRHGRFVPQLGSRHLLTVCGDTYRVAYGQNSTGVRYAWHDAMEFAVATLGRNGIGVRASHQVWDTAFDYPHRALSILVDFFAGKVRDPKLGRMNYTGRCSTGRPVRVNRREEAKDRAHRKCTCGGVLWDWGAGYSCGFSFVNWRCDRCSRTYCQYLDSPGLYAIRNQGALRARLALASDGEKE